MTLTSLFLRFASVTLFLCRYNSVTRIGRNIRPASG